MTVCVLYIYNVYIMPRYTDICTLDAFSSFLTPASFYISRHTLPYPLHIFPKSHLVLVYHSGTLKFYMHTFPC